MSIIDTAAAEYRDLPIAVLTESRTNPRRIFEDDALKELDQANQLAPDNADVLYTLGQVYGKLMSATYQKLSQVAPDSYRVHQLLGESYVAQKETDKAATEAKPEPEAKR